MTLRRATLYIGGASLLVAWFSSAASLSLARNPRQPAQTAAEVASPTDGVAGNVQAQARRLKLRLAAAPLPQQPYRNPFAFRPRPSAPPPRVRQTAPAVEPIEAAIPDPRLELVGVAERRTATGVARTAMITGEGNDLIMADLGGSVLGRYTVTAIDPDAVQLTDVATGRTRRLALQQD